MKFQNLIVAGLFLASSTVMASIIQFGAGTDSIEGVPVSLTAIATVDGRVSNLEHVASGLRTKKVAFVHVKVYVAQFFATDHTKIACTVADTLNSLDDPAQKTVALTMSFVYTVDAPTVFTSFQDSFAANNVSMTDPSISGFLNLVQNAGPANSGTNLLVVGEKLADGTEAVTFENSAGVSNTVVGQKGFIKSVMSIWLGQPAAGDTDLGVLINTLDTCGAK